jgi:hypothetical protein
MAETNNSHDNGLYTYDSFGGASRKPSDKKFLWWCAGAHQDLLKQFPSEHAKHSGLGGVLVATLVLASLAAGYAIYTVFDNWMYAIGFGIIWGLIIFNFDRFLVSTMRKYGISKRKQLWMAVPRLVLALLIGFTIARPLEMKIFEKEINVKMTQNLHKKIQLNDSLLARENEAQINDVTAERQRLINRKDEIEDTLHRLQQAYVQEADGTGGSGQRGIEELTHLKINAFDQVRTQFGPEVLQLERKIAAQDDILTNAKANMEQKRNEFSTSAAASMGFLERNKALSDLSGEEASVFWSCLLISLLIILIEVGPILSKLIMPIGPYDIALAKEELLQMAADENHIRADKEIRNEKKKAFFQRQKDMSEQLVNKLTELQKKKHRQGIGSMGEGRMETGRPSCKHGRGDEEDKGTVPI